jgi:antitoxin VapB
MTTYIQVMTTHSFGSRTFKSGNSEAVRLPKGAAYGAEIEVTIVRSGDVLTIYPARPPIADLAARLATLPKPAEVEARDTDPLPEPEGR